MIFDIVLFSEVEQVLSMPILHEISQKGIMALKCVQGSQQVLLFVQFPSIFGMLRVNKDRRSTPTGIDNMIRSYCIYTLLLSAISQRTAINDFLRIENYYSGEIVV